MRALLVAAALAAGCHSPSDMHRDLDRLCSADSVAHMTSMPAWGSWYEGEIHSAEMKQAIAALKSGQLDLPAFLKLVDTNLAAEHIDACPGADRLKAPRPTTP